MIWIGDLGMWIGWRRRAVGIVCPRMLCERFGVSFGCECEGSLCFLGVSPQYWLERRV